MLPGGCHHLSLLLSPELPPKGDTSTSGVRDHSRVTNSGSPSWAAPSQRECPGAAPGHLQDSRDGEVGTNGAGTPLSPDETREKRWQLKVARGGWRAGSRE